MIKQDLFSGSKQKKERKYSCTGSKKSKNKLYHQLKISDIAEQGAQNRPQYYLPGFLIINLDKEKNSYEIYQKIRSVCEGINDVVR